MKIDIKRLGKFLFCFFLLHAFFIAHTPTPLQQEKNMALEIDAFATIECYESDDCALIMQRLPLEKTARMQKIRRLIASYEKIAASYQREIHDLTKFGLNLKSPEITFAQKKLTQTQTTRQKLEHELAALQ